MDPETTLSGMEALISNLTSIVSAVTGYVGDVVELFTTEGNELLLLFALVPLVGIGVGLFKRLLSVN